MGMGLGGWWKRDVNDLSYTEFFVPFIVSHLFDCYCFICRDDYYFWFACSNTTVGEGAWNMSDFLHYFRTCLHFCKKKVSSPLTFGGMDIRVRGIEKQLYTFSKKCTRFFKRKFLAGNFSKGERYLSRSLQKSTPIQSHHT
jgi:hypothetical protein